MASAKKCDRCGECFDKRTSVTDPLNDKFNFNYLCTGEEEEEDDKIKVRAPFMIDLCEGCLNSFVDWLKYEKSHEEVCSSGEEYKEFDTACNKYINIFI